MPVEIRELIIRTEIQTENTSSEEKVVAQDLSNIKKQLYKDIKKLVDDSRTRQPYKR